MSKGYQQEDINLIGKLLEGGYNTENSKLDK